jgi:hypothetical protein
LDVVGLREEDWIVSEPLAIVDERPPWDIESLAFEPEVLHGNGTGIDIREILPFWCVNKCSPQLSDLCGEFLPDLPE